MKVIHVIDSIDNSIGGPARSVSNLVTGILKLTDSNLFLFCLRSSSPIISSFEQDNGKIVFFSPFYLKYKYELKERLQVEEVSIFHGHGLWQMSVHIMAKVGRKRNIPYVISPRGMLDKWPLKHKALKKKIALWLFQHEDIKQATVIHATSNSEVKNIRDLGYKNPIALIPNGIELPFVISKENKSNGKYSVLFLSRLVKNKGIEELLIVWSLINKADKKNWQLTIIGEGEPSYVNSLKKMQSELNLSNIVFLGAIYDERKQLFLNEADLFVLPSYTENFGIVIAEALASCTPVITTKGAPWQDLETHQCGWWIDIGVNPLKQALETAMQTNDEVLIEMGKRGRKLIEDKYSSTSLAKQMLELYLWILKKGPQPNFVSIE